MTSKTKTSAEKTDWTGAFCGLCWLGVIGFLLYHANALSVAIPAFACIYIAKIVGALRD